MTDEKKTTPESTKRFRLCVAALRNLGQAADHEVGQALSEFESFHRLYVAARLREVDARNPPLTRGLGGFVPEDPSVSKGAVFGAVAGKEYAGQLAGNHQK